MPKIPILYGEVIFMVWSLPKLFTLISIYRCPRFYVLGGATEPPAENSSTQPSGPPCTQPKKQTHESKNSNNNSETWKRGSTGRGSGKNYIVLCLFVSFCVFLFCVLLCSFVFMCLLFFVVCVFVLLCFLFFICYVVLFVVCL